MEWEDFFHRSHFWLHFLLPILVVQAFAYGLRVIPPLAQQKGEGQDHVRFAWLVDGPCVFEAFGQTGSILVGITLVLSGKQAFRQSLAQEYWLPAKEPPQIQ